MRHTIAPLLATTLLPTLLGAPATAQTPGSSWEVAAGPVAWVPLGESEAAVALELRGVRLWGEDPVRRGLELSSSYSPGDGVGSAAAGVFERRSVGTHVDFTAHLGLGALFYREEGLQAGTPPCPPDDLDACPPSPGTAPRTDRLRLQPLGYVGVGLEFGRSDRLRIRPGARIAMIRLESRDFLHLVELPLAVVVRF